MVVFDGDKSHAISVILSLNAMGLMVILSLTTVVFLMVMDPMCTIGKEIPLHQQNPSSKWPNWECKMGVTNYWNSLAIALQVA